MSVLAGVTARQALIRSVVQGQSARSWRSLALAPGQAAWQVEQPVAQQLRGRVAQFADG